MSTPALPFGLTPSALDAAMSEVDPGSLAAATRLRSRFGPELATAALHQAALRRQAERKFGDLAAEMFFTRAGLEQATRPSVADHHAARMVAAGARRVVDLGCGIGADALAFVRAGLEVLAVERDPDTAAVAAANLADAVGAGAAEVRCADAEQIALDADDAVFLDPARRNDRGRLWRIEDFSPPWSLVSAILDGSRPAGVKLGPALPHAFVPATAEAEWTTDRGETVEVALWAGSGAAAGSRSALIMPTTRMLVTDSDPLDVGPLDAVLYEPDGAVIRAGGIAQLGRALGAHLLDPQIAYLTGGARVETPYAAVFAVREQLPYDLKRLRRWVADQGIGRLEIKKRGLDLDPAELRRRLKPAGPNAATLLLTRTPTGALAVFADRVS